MSDKTVIITGGNTGLGYECAKCIAASEQGWRIVIAGRSKEKISEAAKLLNATATNSPAEALTLDLASLKSIRNFVEEFSAQGFPPLRALVCNAGIQVVSGTTFTEDGFETTFGVNHLGHFLLVNLLLKHLAASVRIVVVSSDTHDPEKKTGMPSPHYENATLSAWPDKETSSPKALKGSALGRQRYTTSKLCNLYFAYELSRRLEKQGLSTNQKPVTVNAFNPGLMPGTGLARDYNAVQRFAWNYVLPILRPISRFFMPMNRVEDSGKALARLVLDPALETVTGKYYSGMNEERSSKESYDTKKALELWETSIRLVKFAPEEA
ncbi:MAG: SDR family NAD(P)-dependent oxidoreductase [Desulfobacteraceae bacterium]|nr:MAG: SDR family NAD(P)-dependent oxidoreductase [Desulfobacteraceae bacterium]